MSDHRSLSRLLAWVAQALDDRNAEVLAYGGIVRQAATVLATLPEPAEDGCRRCGDPLVQPATGRRRVWCSETCRRAV